MAVATTAGRRRRPRRPNRGGLQAARLADRGDISTTHLEYRTACDAGIPVHVYVRDRLRAEYDAWCSNRGATFTWISPGEHGVFELMAEHDAKAKDAKSNWLSTFQNGE